MADMFKYPVFFECSSLQQEHMKKIEDYFQIKQRSGGGECGPLKRVDNNIYSVAFKDQSDQQRVLQKSEHVVDDLVFTVRDSLEAGSSSPVRLDSASVQSLTLQDNDVLQPEEAVHQPDQESTPKRIVILGKTGSGKSSLANTIIGEKLFATNHSSGSVMSQCQTETRSVHGRSITLIDTPGLLDTVRSEEALKSEVVRCLTECSPGPHAFLIVLKVERFTEEEEAVVTKICQYFSEDALKYAVVVFTHGDQLDEGQKIEALFSENQKLSDLVQKCGGRCHVIDNKYWKNNEEDDYRNNRVQVEKLLHTIDKMVMENKGGCYTNDMLQEIERQIQTEKIHIPQMRRVGTGAAVVGAAGAVGAVGAAAAGLPATAIVGIALTVAAVAAAAAAAGGVIGYKASEGAESPGEAAKKVAMEEVISSQHNAKEQQLDSRPLLNDESEPPLDN